MSELDYVPFMREAIDLAEQGRWHACPNPTVGAVLVLPTIAGYTVFVYRVFGGKTTELRYG